jgi:hypothetical protein
MTTSLDERRAQIWELLAAGMGVRQIAAKTGIPSSSVQRAKKSLERLHLNGELPNGYAGTAEVIVISEPSNPATEGVAVPSSADAMPPAPVQAPPGVRRYTIEISDQVISGLIRRGLLAHDDRDKPGVVLSALYADEFSDYTVEWLQRHGWRGAHGNAEAIIASINEAFTMLPR